jgi:periplasmic iron binding protein
MEPENRLMRPVLTFLLALLPISAQAAVIGGPMVRDGVEIVPSIETSVQFDRQPVVLAPGSIFFVADVHASKDNAYGLTGFIPYLSVSFTLTKDGELTFKKAGLLYPTANKNGPRYIGAAQMNGPGTYHLTYFVSAPSAHGMYRQIGKDGGVPDWWKPITATWDFSYPASSNIVSAK